ncbi:MAG: NAD-dependent epimerase/dehydratase family protein [Candidatus Lokiarchaeota archaeon]|nr:NAD-dependent epimerase/dehydratase family protein [Candidatus Lokiarchaeota archaeon]
MNVEGKTVFLTGGAGFIGSHLARKYSELGANVLIYDNLSTGFEDFLSDIPNLTLIKGDIIDAELVQSSMKGCDIVSHHAAELEVFTGIDNTIHEMRVNIEGTLNVLNAAIKNDVEKVIYASSGGVYGQATYIPENEDHPLMPQWPYGVSKLAGEKYCQQYTQLYGLPTVAFRYGIVYGPHEWYGRVLTMFIKRVLSGKPPVIFGRGTQKRDFVYVSDVVKANILGTQKDDISGMRFNIGGNSSVSVVELANLVIKLINPKLQPIFDDPKPGEFSKYQPERKRLPAELKDFILDITSAKEKLGYYPEVEFEEGIRKEIEWFKANPHVWDYNPRV